MSFALYAITMKDFKCYRGSHEFEFPMGSGLYYLTGKNSFNDRLGANGTGKSTIIDGINWCLYGKTARGLRASDVISWGASKCKVSVTCLVDEEEIEITRTQNPNKIFINDEPSSQEEVIKLLNLNQEAFNASIIIPQFGESFFDLSPSKKLEIFSQVMDLDYWLSKSDEASRQTSLLANNIAIIEKDIERTLGTKDGITANIEEYKLKADEFDSKRGKELKNLKSHIADIKTASLKSSSQIKKHRKLFESLTKDRVEVISLVEEIGVEFQSSSDKVSSLNTDIKTNNRHVKELNDALTSFEEMKGIICPECKQEVDAKHVAKHQSRLVKKVESLKAANISLNKKLNKAQDKLSQSRSEINDLNKLRVELSDKIYDCGHKITSCERDISDADRNTKQLLAKVKELKEQENPFEALIETSKKRRKKLSLKVKELKQKLREEKIQHTAYSYWIAGFKRVRLFVIEEALNSLEIEINNLLVSLGLVGWKITLDVERETKSGTISKGFTVLIQSPKHEKPVKFESWSGGETQRLRLAGDLGLANLIMEQAGYINSIEIIDEPSIHMSQEGIEDLLETLQQRAINEDKQIWIVDHHTVEFAGFSGVLTTVMDEKGNSHLEYEG